MAAKVVEEEDIGEITDFKVYVSRIPSKWTKELMMEHFTSLGFGDVAGVDLFTSKARKHVTRRGAGNLCYAFKNEGKCDKGDACLFSHGVEDAAAEEEEKLGSGCVYFFSEESMNAALEQRVLYVSHRSIKISPFQSAEEGRDTVTCYAWQKFQCTHGDTCKFAHQGDGGCMAVGVPYQGRKFQCMSFKAKGKCSKGDKCLFLHSLAHVKNRDKSKSSEKDTKKRSVTDAADDGGWVMQGEKEEEEADCVEDGKEKEKGVCNNLKRKGKCRKGDRCPYSHDLSSAATSARASTASGITPAPAQSQQAMEANAKEEDIRKKRRKVTGSFLVEVRKQNKITSFSED